MHICEGRSWYVQKTMSYLHDAVDKHALLQRVDGDEVGVKREAAHACGEPRGRLTRDGQVAARAALHPPVPTRAARCCDTK